MERRTNERYAVDTEVDLRFLPNYGFMAAHTRNVSINSMFINTGLDEPIEHRLVLFKLGRTNMMNHKPEYLSGVIVRQSKDGFALRFSCKEAIIKFISDLSSKN